MLLHLFGTCGELVAARKLTGRPEGTSVGPPADCLIEPNSSMLLLSMLGSLFLIATVALQSAWTSFSI